MGTAGRPSKWTRFKKTLRGLCGNGPSRGHFVLRAAKDFDDLAKYRRCGCLTVNGRHYFFLDAIWFGMNLRKALYHRKSKAHLTQMMIDKLEGKAELIVVDREPYWMFSIKEFPRSEGS